MTQPENFATSRTKASCHLLKLLAAASGAGAFGHAADAADLIFDSGPISSSNVVGWNSPYAGDEVLDFKFTATGGREFRFLRAGSISTVNQVLFTRFAMASNTFRMATSYRNSLSAALVLFASGDRWDNLVTASKPNGFIGSLSSYPRGQVTPEENVYFLFKFQDSGTDYYGWINADIMVDGEAGQGSNYVRINRYAWQSSTLGILPAGVTPVPEPSTLVTSGIAALAGGAVALRRWRKERKAKTDAA